MHRIEAVAILAGLVQGCAYAPAESTRSSFEPATRPHRLPTDFFGEDIFLDSVRHYQMSMEPSARAYPRFARIESRR